MYSKYVTWGVGGLVIETFDALAMARAYVTSWSSKNLKDICEVIERVI